MSPVETEQALRELFKKLRSPAHAECLYPKPPARCEVIGFALYYKKTLVREYFGKEILKEFERTCREKMLLDD